MLDQQEDVFMTTNKSASASKLTISGQIISIVGASIGISAASGEVFTLSLSPLTDIWKGKHNLPSDTLLIGDSVIAFVRRNSDDGLSAIEIYANIVNMYGRIMAIGGNEMEILPYSLERGRMLVNPIKKIVFNHAGVKTVMRFEEGCGVEVGRMLSFVGCILPDGRLQVSRAWFTLQHRSVPPEEASS